MFFNTNLKEEINSLKNKIASLEQQLNEKTQELEHKNQEFLSLQSSQIKKDSSNEIELLQAIAAHSQEEALVVFDSNGHIYFSNDLAKSNIKSFEPILEAVHNKQETIVMEDCEAKLKVATNNNYKIVSLKKR